MPRCKVQDGRNRSQSSAAQKNMVSERVPNAGSASLRPSGVTVSRRYDSASLRGRCSFPRIVANE